MYTICWVNEKGYDRWDRLPKKELVEFINKNFILNGNVDEDILVFAPDSEANINDILKQKQGVDQD